MDNRENLEEDILVEMILIQLYGMTIGWNRCMQYSTDNCCRKVRFRFLLKNFIRVNTLI